MKLNKYALVMWLLMPIAGCASFTDARYEHTQKARAKAAWRCVPDQVKQHCYPKDYEKGWKDGFYDVATGGKGCPPVVAPQEYWRPVQILEHCDNRRHAYYDGFQDGAACASRYPDTHHLKMWSSCECPLPTCENQCIAGSACPTGACGFSAFPETIIEGEPLPLEAWGAPAALPTAEPLPATSPLPTPVNEATELPAPQSEVVPPAPEPKAVDATKPVSMGVGSTRASDMASTSVRNAVDVSTALDAKSVRKQSDNFKSKESEYNRMSVKQSRPVVAIAEPIVDSVWLDLDSDQISNSPKALAPAASPPALPQPSKAVASKPLVAKPASSMNIPTSGVIEPSKGIASEAKPFTVPTVRAPASAKVIQTPVKNAPLHTEGLIEQSTVELAKPIATQTWGMSVDPVVRMATGMELPSK